MPALRQILVESGNPLGKCPVWIHGKIEDAAAAIIVIQEWWGVNDYIKNTVQQIGEATGYVTLVPDLYRGKVGHDRETAGHLMNHLDWSGAIEDIDSCARYLKTQGVKKVGVTGFCMGGALTLGVAALKTSVDAAAPFYGIPRKEYLGNYDEKNIKIPIQCHFGEKDQAVGLSSPTDYEALRARLTEAQVKYEFFTYPAGHAFSNPTAQSYDPDSKELSFKRMYKFFTEHLTA